MGNAVDKSKGRGYYGVSREGFCFEDDQEGFVIVKATRDSSPGKTDEEEECRTAGRRSPFEHVTSGQTTCAEVTDKKDLEGSIDSGYADNPAAANRSRGASPEPIPVPNDHENEHQLGHADMGEPTDHDMNLNDCRTARSLGKHHAYFGYRFYHYNDIGCEGNKHILDQDL